MKKKIILTIFLLVGWAVTFGLLIPGYVDEAVVAAILLAIIKK